MQEFGEKRDATDNDDGPLQDVVITKLPENTGKIIGTGRDLLKTGILSNREQTSHTDDNN